MQKRQKYQEELAELKRLAAFVPRDVSRRVTSHGGRKAKKLSHVFHAQVPEVDKPKRESGRYAAGGASCEGGNEESP